MLIIRLDNYVRRSLHNGMIKHITREDQDFEEYPLPERELQWRYQCHSFLLRTMTDTAKTKIKKSKTLYQVWMSLQTLYQAKGCETRVTWTKEFYVTKLTDFDKTMTDYLDHMKKTLWYYD